MSRRSCPNEPAVLAATRRAGIDPSIADHLRSCPECADAVATERALALLAGAGDPGPFPAPRALRLEAELRSEERRAARRARRLIALQAGGLVVSLALLAAVRLSEVGAEAGMPALGGAGTVCAVVVVLVSIWNLVRAAQETAVPS